MQKFLRRHYMFTKRLSVLLCAAVLTGCTATAGTTTTVIIMPQPVNAILLQGVVVDVTPVFETKYRAVRNKICVNKQVPIYSNTKASNTLIIIGSAVSNFIAPGATSVAEYNGSAIVERVTGVTVTELTDQQNVVGYKTVPDCRIEETVIQEQVIASYNVIVRLGEQDLKFITNRGYQIGQTVMIDVNRRLL